MNKKMEDVPIGYEVGIIYQGEKPSAPPKKPFKIFKVFKRNPDKPNNSFADVKEAEIIDTMVDDLIDDHMRSNYGINFRTC